MVLWTEAERYGVFLARGVGRMRVEREFVWSRDMRGAGGWIELLGWRGGKCSMLCRGAMHAVEEVPSKEELVKSFAAAEQGR